VKISLVALFVLLVTGVASAATPQSAQFQALLSGAGHQPVAGEDWVFVVRAVDSAGKPVSATAIVRVFVDGKPVDTVGWFGFKGKLRRTYRWSPELLGSRALLRVKVVGPGGSRFVAYSVRVVSDWPSSTGHPTFRVSLAGQTRAPVAGAPWRYVVHAANTNGTRFSGTAVLRVLANGRVADTLGWFGFKRTLRGTYRWSRQLRHDVALFQVKVIGPGGTRATSYRVRVR
jgi:hypothetical protein